MTSNSSPPTPPSTTVFTTTPRTIPMPRPDPTPTQLDRDLADLKLLEIAKSYREVLDEAARKGSSMLEMLATLIGLEQTVRQQLPSALRATLVTLSVCPV